MSKRIMSRMMKRLEARNEGTCSCVRSCMCEGYMNERLSRENRKLQLITDKLESENERLKAAVVKLADEVKNNVQTGCDAEAYEQLNNKYIEAVEELKALQQYYNTDSKGKNGGAIKAYNEALAKPLNEWTMVEVRALQKLKQEACNELEALKKRYNEVTKDYEALKERYEMVKQELAELKKEKNVTAPVGHAIECLGELKAEMYKVFGAHDTKNKAKGTDKAAKAAEAVESVAETVVEEAEAEPAVLAVESSSESIERIERVEGKEIKVVTDPNDTKIKRGVHHKPWEAYGLKKTTYYKRKAEGTLPELKSE